jgi:hypothetical protein
LFVVFLSAVGVAACGGSSGDPTAGTHGLVDAAGGAVVDAAAGDAAASDGTSNDGTSNDGTSNDGGHNESGNSAGDAGLLVCDGTGPLYPMAADPDTGAVDVSVYCLGRINDYRAKSGLAPYHLHDTSPAAMCCQAAEAKTAAEIGGHSNGGCGWQSQGFCGGGRNPGGNVQASIDWCPRLFFEEGPTGGHYQAMMRVEPRGIMCSFYAVSRDKHAIVVNYY